MISATDSPFCRLDLLVELDKAPADLLRQHLAEGGFAGAAQPDQRDAGKRHLCAPRRRGRRDMSLGLRDLARRRLAQEIADHGPVRRRFACGNEVFEMRAHRVRHPAQQHDRDVALAAFELGDIAFGNAGDLCQHLARHAAQRAHGADTLAELLEKAGFGIEIFGHIPCRSSRLRLAARLGNIMPTRIDSKRVWCISMNYNS